MQVRAKKHLGQHFLKDLSIAKRIAGSLELDVPTKVLEVGPGTGVLTQFLLKDKFADLHVIELDKESVEFLNKNFTALKDRIIEADFLKYNIKDLYGEEPFALIGNFPYNISSQIYFKVLEHKDQIPVISGMLQKEVAQRIASKPGCKAYGILSVLLQAYYDIDYLFEVPPTVFVPAPRVDSAVIRLRRNSRKELPCNDSLFKAVVKTAFNQRRKTLRNSLKSMMQEGTPKDHPLFTQRPEQLGTEEFIQLVNFLSPK